MMMFFDPSYSYPSGYNPFRKRRKKVKYPTTEDDFIDKFMKFQWWLENMEERKKTKDSKKDEKKPDKKPDFVGLSMFLMVLSFFGGQVSLMYLYQLFAAIPK